MLDLLQVLHAKIQQAKDEQDLFNMVADFSKNIGFEHCSYIFRSMKSPARCQVKVFDTYPGNCVRPYEEQGGFKIDPNITRGGGENELIVWQKNVQIFGSDFVQVDKNYGLNYGVSKFSWGPCGEFGFFSLSRAQNPLSQAELDLLRPCMCLLASYMHIYMSKFVNAQKAKWDPKLTEREIDVIRWTAEGKTSEEIGSILGISKRTVDYHIYNIISKTDSRNKVQAAIKVVLFGGGSSTCF
jgi:LuxR family quorum-sensing system transcriptional regulator SolR